MGSSLFLGNSGTTGGDVGVFMSLLISLRVLCAARCRLFSRKVFVSLMVGLVLQPGISLAEAVDPGWYMGYGLSHSSLQPETQNTVFRVSDNSDSGFQLLLGYRFLPAWQAEFSYADLGEAELAFTAGANAGNIAGVLSYKETGLSLLWSPWAPDEAREFRLEPFLQGGIRYASHNFSENFRVDDRYSGFFAVGAEARWHSGFAVRLSYASYSEDTESLQVSFVGYIGDWQSQ